MLGLLGRVRLNEFRSGDGGVDLGGGAVTIICRGSVTCEDLRTMIVGTRGLHLNSGIDLRAI
jgi:hypothetical protein